MACKIFEKLCIEWSLEVMSEWRDSREKLGAAHTMTPYPKLDSPIN